MRRYACLLLIVLLSFGACKKLFPDYRDQYVGTYQCHSTYSGLVYDSQNTATNARIAFNVDPHDYKMKVDKSAIHNKIILRDSLSNYEVDLDNNGAFTDHAIGSNFGVSGSFIQGGISMSKHGGGIAAGHTDITGKKE